MFLKTLQGVFVCIFSYSSKRRKLVNLSKGFTSTCLRILVNMYNKLMDILPVVYGSLKLSHMYNIYMMITGQKKTLLQNNNKWLPLVNFPTNNFQTRLKALKYVLPFPPEINKKCCHVKCQKIPLVRWKLVSQEWMLALCQNTYGQKWLFTLSSQHGKCTLKIMILWSQLLNRRGVPRNKS